jgi:DNA-binding NarL/FixJ family response regulator
MTSATSPTQVIILAEAALPRLAWQALLAGQPGLMLWGTAVSVDDILALPPTNGATAVLLDFARLPIQQVAQLAGAFSPYGLLCLINEYDLEQTVILLQAGAAGILSRDATLPELTRALVAIGRGEIVLPPSLAARALAALARGEVQPQQNPETLTERERDVLTLLAQGLTNKDIAQSMFLSVRTVEAHLRNVYGKLNVTSRTEAVLWAVQHGLKP